MYARDAARLADALEGALAETLKRGPGRRNTETLRHRITLNDACGEPQTRQGARMDLRGRPRVAFASSSDSVEPAASVCSDGFTIRAHAFEPVVRPTATYRPEGTVRVVCPAA